MADQFRLELPERDPDDELPELETPAPSLRPSSPGTHKVPRHGETADDNPPAADSLDPMSDADQLWLAEVERESAAFRRFSLAELLLTTALFAVILTAARFFRRATLAGCLGLIVLGGLALMLTDRRPRWLYLVWTVLLASYITTALWAAAEQD